RARLRAGRVHLGGNIGGSLLPTLDRIHPDDAVVLELSSAMLHWIGETLVGERAFAPKVAAMTNLAPNHLDWHGDASHYRASKARLVARQRPGDAAVFADESIRFDTPPGVRVVAPDAVRTLAASVAARRLLVP